MTCKCFADIFAHPMLLCRDTYRETRAKFFSHVLTGVDTFSHMLTGVDTFSHVLTGVDTFSHMLTGVDTSRAHKSG